MKSLFKRLKVKKGFTLVECIVAIAVFAAFCLMIMIIIAGAQKEAKIANDTEKELDGLVNGVVNDDVNRGYNSAYTNTMSLELSGDGVTSTTNTFAITYDVINGYKNHVLCSKCGYFANNTEFMGGVNSESFQPWTTNYKCPMCGATIMGSDFTLKCGDCGKTAYYTGCDKEYNSLKAWTYSSGSGSFTCNSCGGADVSYVNLEEQVFNNSHVAVSGMAANAIRYGRVKRPSMNAVVVVTDDSGAANDKVKANVYVKYDGDPKKSNQVGEYTITISGIQKPDDPDLTDLVRPQTKIAISIPKGYYFEDFKCNGSTTLPGNLSITDPTQDNNGAITWTTTGPNAVGDTVSFKFKLRNYKTGFSFDYDYQNMKYKDKDDKDVTGTGLAQYWFSLSNNGGSENWPL